MAIALESNAAVQWDGNAEEPVENFTYDSGSGGSDRCLFVVVITESTTPTAVTYNSVPMTKVAEFDDTLNVVQVWRLVNPSTGSNTVAVSNVLAADQTIHAVCYNGVDQTTPTGQTTTNDGSFSTTGEKTTTLTTNNANSFILTAAAIDGGSAITELGPISTFSDIAGDNEEFGDSNPNRAFVTGIYDRSTTTAQSYTVGFDYQFAGTKDAIGIHVEINEAAAAGPPSITANQTEAGDSTTAALSVLTQLSANQTEAGDATTAALSVLTQLSANQPEAGDATTAALSTSQDFSITANQLEAGDATLATLSVLTQLSANQLEAGDATTAAISAPAQLSANQAEDGDATTAAISTSQQASITANQPEEGDATTATLSVLAQLSANQLEDGDATTAVLIVFAQLSANQVEEGDTTAASFAEEAASLISANQVEEGDTTMTWIGLPPQGRTFKVTVPQRLFKVTVPQRKFVA